MLEQFYAKLVNYYSFFDLIMIVIVGFVFISMAIFVRRKSPNNDLAAMFHLVSLGLGIVIIINAGNYIALPFGYGYLSRVIWLFAYSLIPVVFISLTTSLTGKPIPGIKIPKQLIRISIRLNCPRICFKAFCQLSDFCKSYAR